MIILNFEDTEDEKMPIKIKFTSKDLKKIHKKNNY
jgi:hypothetical protein